jgi:glucose-6-phosphate isomerase
MAVEFTPVNKTNAWARLTAHRQAGAVNLRQAFASDPRRVEAHSIRTEHIYYDYTRQLVNGETVKLLFDLAEERSLKDQVQAMFKGEKINITEGRSVLHTALRDPAHHPEVNEVLRQTEKFSYSVIGGRRTGVTGKQLKNILAIGIGGSYLGPEYLAEACTPSSVPDMRLRFVANVDGTDFAKKTADLDPAETLVIVISKTFTTAETMKNAQTAKKWMKDALGPEPEVIKRHFIAVSTAKEKVEAFGIDSQNMFGFWDWVGGRYSATSAVGAVPLSLYLDYDNYAKVLRGANWMDQHFLNTPLDQNIPVISALLDVWNINFLGYKTRALLPYCQGLAKLPAHTQQVEMESNGKQVDILGRPLEFDTGEVVFGEPGTNGQHSFYQLIHQGTQIIPCDFIGFLRSQYPIPAEKREEVSHHEELMTNFFAQPDALAFGKEDTNLAKNFPGNRPSSSMLLEQLDPFTAGMLLAWTEHRAAVKGFIWGINSFDQFGVELGKVLGIKVREEMLRQHEQAKFEPNTGNPSTDLMLKHFFCNRLPT